MEISKQIQKEYLGKLNFGLMGITRYYVSSGTMSNSKPCSFLENNCGLVAFIYEKKISLEIHENIFFIKPFFYLKRNPIMHRVQVTLGNSINPDDSKMMKEALTSHSP